MLPHLITDPLPLHFVHGFIAYASYVWHACWDIAGKNMCHFTFGTFYYSRGSAVQASHTCWRRFKSFGGEEGSGGCQLCSSPGLRVCECGMSHGGFAYAAVNPASFSPATQSETIAYPQSPSSPYANEHSMVSACERIKLKNWAGRSGEGETFHHHLQ